MNAPSPNVQTPLALSSVDYAHAAERAAHVVRTKIIAAEQPLPYARRSAGFPISVQTTRDLVWLDEMFNTYGRQGMGGVFTMLDAWLDRRNVFLQVFSAQAPVGYFSLRYKFSGVYEVHVCMSRSCRGADAVMAFAAMKKYAFGELMATALTATSPARNRAATWMALRAGFKIEFQLPTADGGYVSYLTLRKGT